LPAARIPVAQAQTQIPRFARDDRWKCDIAMVKKFRIKIISAPQEKYVDYANASAI
jgi:hypothetical protein